MSRAAIDIGSNTVRLLVADVKSCRIAPLRYEQVITRLSRGLSKTGRLGEQAMSETVEVLRTYKEIAEKYRVDEVVASGTEALRVAENASKFIRTAHDNAGIIIEVLSGHMEAQLMALGVARSLPESDNAFVLDIGGASTEVIIVRNGQTRSCQTVPTGVVKLLERHVSKDPPATAELHALETASMDIGNKLRQDVSIPFAMGHETPFISTAGTPTTLAAIDLGLKAYDRARVHGHKMTLKKLEEMLLILASVTLEERVRMGCLDPKRADLIIPGLILTIGIMKSFGFHEMTVSDQGLLEGLLLRAAGCAH